MMYWDAGCSVIPAFSYQDELRSQTVGQVLSPGPPEKEVAALTTWQWRSFETMQINIEIEAP